MPGARRWFGMTNRKDQAAQQFRRMFKWIILAGIGMAGGALVYLRLVGAWSQHAVIATVLGVFVSVVLGSGLFALAFFSDKSGHDDAVDSLTSRQDDP